MALKKLIDGIDKVDFERKIIHEGSRPEGDPPDSRPDQTPQPPDPPSPAEPEGGGEPGGSSGGGPGN